MLFSDERGVTLLEAVVALTILALVGTAALAAVGSDLRAAERGRRAIEAAALAQEQMVQLTLLRANDLQPIPDSLRHGRFPSPLDDYQWEAEARAVPDEPDTYEVAVAITWQDRGRYALDTRVYRPRPFLAGH